MLERANPAVVNIATRSTVVEHNRLLADPFFGAFLISLKAGAATVGPKALARGGG